MVQVYRCTRTRSIRRDALWRSCRFHKAVTAVPNNDIPPSLTKQLATLSISAAPHAELVLVFTGTTTPRSMKDYCGNSVSCAHVAVIPVLRVVVCCHALHASE